MTLKFRINELEELNNVVRAVLNDFRTEKIFLLNGDLGAGKTTIIKEFAKVLGYLGVVQSPTYSLVNEYPLANSRKIFHFDLYRLRDMQEAINIGIEDYLESKQYCFIEWHEVIDALLPEDCILINIKLDNEFRNIEVYRKV